MINYPEAGEASFVLGLMLRSAKFVLVLLAYSILVFTLTLRATGRLLKVGVWLHSMLCISSKACRAVPALNPPCFKSLSFYKGLAELIL